jgi:hypothetical protein
MLITSNTVIRELAHTFLQQTREFNFGQPHTAYGIVIQSTAMGTRYQQIMTLFNEPNIH